MYEAIKSFSGVISMSVGDVKDINDVNIAKDLLKAGYIREVKPAEKVKTTKATTNKKPVTKGRTKRG